MLTHPTIDQLRALRLDGMAEAFVELQSQDAARDPPWSSSTGSRGRQAPDSVVAFSGMRRNVWDLVLITGGRVGQWKRAAGHRIEGTGYIF
jgi:hypothetical protein